MSNELSDLITFAHQLADASGAVIRPYFGAHGEVEAKGDSSPVTQADRAAEQAIRALIAQHYPDHAIYGEEFGTTQHSSPSCVAEGEPRQRQGSASETSEGGASPPSENNYTWVIDPIDGTRAFIAGKKEWGTLIALCENGVPILGVFDQPVTGERWVGAKGLQSLYFCHPRASVAEIPTGISPQHFIGDPVKEIPAFAGMTNSEISVRACASLAEASISTTSKYYFTPPQAAQFIKLAEQCAEVTEDGDCYAYGLMARGMRDMVVDAGLKPYDILALVPIIEGAKGIITGWEGGKLTLGQCDKVVASGDPRCHALALAALRA